MHIYLNLKRLLRGAVLCPLLPSLKNETRWVATTERELVSAIQLWERPSGEAHLVPSLWHFGTTWRLLVSNKLKILGHHSVSHALFCTIKMEIKPIFSVCWLEEFTWKPRHSSERESLQETIALSVRFSSTRDKMSIVHFILYKW